MTFIERKSIKATVLDSDMDMLNVVANFLGQHLGVIGREISEFKTSLLYLHGWLGLSTEALTHKNSSYMYR